MLYLCVVLLLFLTKCYVFSGNTAVFFNKEFTPRARDIDFISGGN